MLAISYVRLAWTQVQELKRIMELGPNRSDFRPGLGREMITGLKGVDFWLVDCGLVS